MYDIAQLAGSLLVLAAFIAAITGRLQQSSTAYLVGNAVGSGVLAATALLGHEWGFLLLEGVWAVVSTYSLARTALGRSPLSGH